jgi:hypothetical protein
MSYMNCQELKSYCGNISLNGDTSAEPGLTEHIAGCPKCSRFIEQQKELRASLAFLRESASSPSSALDQRVLANYREHVAGLRASAQSATVRKPVSTAWLRWSLGFAAAMALVTILLWPRKQPGVVIQATVPPPAVSSTRSDGAPKVATIPRRSAGEKGKSAVPKPTQSAVSSASIGGSIPEGFKSLMYCDELSCGGAMDVVRIELQPSDAGLTAAAQQGGNVISADVLVGADGIARGIRIVR